MRRTRSFLVLVAALGLAGCAQYSTVRVQRPRYQPVTPVGRVIARAFAHDRREPRVALGEYVNAVRTAELALRKNPADADARGDYNFAVGRILETVRAAELDPWSQPLHVPAPDDGGGEYVLTHRPDPRPQWNPALYEFTPADQFDVRGTYVAQRTVKPGLGAPLVAVGRAPVENHRAEFAMARTYYGVTAVARFDEGTRRCVLGFEDPLATENVRLDGHTYPLAADFTVPLAVLLARENPKKLEIARVLRPGNYAQTARITRLQPYDPGKTVVLCLHGLKDTPATWAPMLNVLRDDPGIRRRYQFWFYSYPSGYPYPYSAAILREQLDAAERRFPLRHKIVLVGHSMGSLIARLMITDSGDKLWLAHFGKPPAQTNLTAPTKRTLAGSLIFRHRDEVGRVIFISGPHRGSDLARNWIGRLASSLVRSPATLLKIGEETTKALSTGDTGSLRLRRIPNSVDTLSPNNRFVKAINTVPLTPGIPYHSIIGDRGRGDTPNSSDGVVPYWSSHLDGAQSELIVPSNHGAHQNPQAIAEVRRILLAR